MDGFVINLEDETRKNENFRQVLFTASHSQLVLMSLKPGEDIGTETHEVDQFIRIEDGRGKFIINSKEYEVTDGWAAVIPAGSEHNLINMGEEMMKLYTVYSPAEHANRTVHKTKGDALAEEE